MIIKDTSGTLLVVPKRNEVVEYDVRLTDETIVEYDIDLSEDMDNSLDTVIIESSPPQPPASFLLPPPLYLGEEDLPQYEGHNMMEDTFITFPLVPKVREVIVEYEITLPDDDNENLLEYDVEYVDLSDYEDTVSP